MKKCYISGAIEHYDIKERRAKFAEAAKEVESTFGMKGVNPFENELWKSGKGETAHWREHMKADIKALLGCDCIYMLQGWELSKGAKLEFDVATSCGIPVVFQTDNLEKLIDIKK